ncbi:MAG: hypothetical protein UT15_C0003G0050 [Berkelbacteria bacterium GW2011_GWA1_39_10]|uniref:Uncharacterized protein n=1 Tax=Berkelbacteria bacterium GW2011_GWA1_39_10 TaxID=1618332 RepID=A0A0G0LSC2_9BACT|nr:MAG: hypothetical protein UT15_C0003G0050 [Berkelbacteria bacterium GW2011_GWA1_39_10]
MIKKQIEQDLIEAMKGKNEEAVSTLRMLKSAIKNSEIQKGQDSDESDILSIIQGQIKSRRDSIELYKKGNRLELAAKEEKEIEILVKYLPEQMNNEEIRVIVKKAITEIGATGIQDMGKVMGKVMPELKGKADGGKISQITKEELPH